MLNGDVTENADVDLKLFSKRLSTVTKRTGVRVALKKNMKSHPDSMALMSKTNKLGSFC